MPAGRSKLGAELLHETLDVALGNRCHRGEAETVDDPGTVLTSPCRSIFFRGIQATRHRPQQHRDSLMTHIIIHQEPVEAPRSVASSLPPIK
jgi:hypothetical protein